jgi:hypothetical protein
MLARTTLRMVLPAMLSVWIFSSVAAAQSQNPESVTEAARRAREQKKAVKKPAKSFTDDDLKPAPPEPAIAQDSTAPPSGAPADATAKDTKEVKEAQDSKELADLKEQVKQAQADYDLYQRARGLQEDSYYSNPSYSRDTAGKTKLENLIQQTKQKKQALDALKAKLDRMLKAQPSPAEAEPPKT